MRMKFAALFLTMAAVARADVCTPNGGVYTITNKINAAAMPQDCTIIRGSVAVLCESGATAPGGGLNHLHFLHAVETIEGFFRIENCEALPSLAELSNLRTIGGSSGIGLQILNNDLLSDVKGLENLDTITEGGVNIFFNDNLCYLDLMDWSRIIPADAIPATVTVKYFQKPARCLVLECNADCDCGYCGGPGLCDASCPAPLQGWIAAPVLCSLLLVGLIVLLVVLCVRGWCEFEGKVTRRPMKSKTVLPDFSPSAGADIWVNTAVDPVPVPLLPAADLPRLRETPYSPPEPAPVVPMAPLTPQPLETLEYVDEGDEAAAQPVDEAFCVCGKPAEFDCSRCAKQSYCSNECQRGDWKKHRERCKQLVEEARLAAEGKVVPPATPVDKCEVCEKAAQFECSRCGGPGYCSADCQRAHWKKHAAECRKSRGARRSVNADSNGAGGASGAGGAVAVEAPAAAEQPAKPADEYIETADKTLKTDAGDADAPAAVPPPQQEQQPECLQTDGQGRESDL